MSAEYTIRHLFIIIQKTIFNYIIFDQNFNQFATRFQEEAQKNATHRGPPTQQGGVGFKSGENRGQKMTSHDAYFQQQQHQHRGSPYREVRRTLYDDEYPTMDDKVFNSFYTNLYITRLYNRGNWYSSMDDKTWKFLYKYILNCVV